MTTTVGFGGFGMCRHAWGAHFPQESFNLKLQPSPPVVIAVCHKAAVPLELEFLVRFRGGE